MDRLPIRNASPLVLSRWVLKVHKAIASRKLFGDGQKILVAVSGGLDSMVLLHVLHRLAPAHGWKLTVAHFNHRLRGQAADADERLVLETARRLGLPAVSGKADVAAAARAAGISLEMAGRNLRHQFFARTARKLHIPAVALAHHADDQVELFFLRLLRGTGGQGLGGMQWSNPSPANSSISLVRPLLDQTKADLLQAAQAAGIPFSDDATNASLDIHRNRVRHELLPLLRKHFQPRLSERVLRLMDVAGAEAALVAELAARWLAAKRPAKFSRLPTAIQRRVIYLQLLELGFTPDFDLVERLRETKGNPLPVASRQWLSRDDAGRLHKRKVQKPTFNVGSRQIRLAGRKGQTHFGGLVITWEIVRAPGAVFKGEPNLECFDADKVGRTICLRHWQPGDRFQPIGMKSARKLQDLFTDLKVPRSQRHERIVAATSRGLVFWVEGVRMAEEFKLEARTLRRLTWRWRRRKL